jgi:tetratricopeptide (TPR) repeat protein
MDRDGQLSFSDDPMLMGINEAYQLIEEGKFPEAVGRIDALLSLNPDYPGLAEGYRTAKFWNNRKGELAKLEKGKQTADFLMTQWEIFKGYAQEKNLTQSNSFKSAMRYVFFTASENYKVAFQSQESTADNFDLLLNLGICFLTLGEHKHAIETLEYARTSYRTSAKLLSILAESYYHASEIPKSLLLFREAFFINPSEIDLGMLKCKPIQDLVKIAGERNPSAHDLREWIPVHGFLEDYFYVKRQLNSQQVENIKRDIYTLETSLKSANGDKLAATNVIPRLINKYLWMLDYFEFQNYDFDSVTEIRKRLLQIDKPLFEEHFRKDKKQKPS